jgi:hypothetical protein
MFAGWQRLFAAGGKDYGHLEFIRHFRHASGHLISVVRHRSDAAGNGNLASPTQGKEFNSHIKGSNHASINGRNDAHSKLIGNRARFGVY